MVQNVDRGDLLAQADERCSHPAGRAALVGLGGVGKSQLAIEYHDYVIPQYAWRTRDRSPDTGVFWVHASNAARFEEGYRDIADAVKIVGGGDVKADIFKLVHDWLRDGSNGKWLLTLDNVDDADFLANTQQVSQSQSRGSTRQALRPLRDCLPQSQNGMILVTTRSEQSALRLVEQNDLIQVQPMDEAHAIELLDKKLEPTVQRDNNHNAELVAILESMPLAIVQASAYISQLGPRYPVQRYTDEFSKNDWKRSSLLNREGGQLRGDGEAKNSIITAWQISFNHISRIRQSATDLLSRMSFFDSQGIPEALVRSRGGEVQGKTRGDRKSVEKCSDEDSGSETIEDDGFEEDVVTPRNFPFITADKTIFQMHKLVQLATRKWLEAINQLETWKQQYTRNPYTEIPTRRFENWPQYQTLFPHMQSAIAQRPKDEVSLLQWASILHIGSWYALRRGNVAAAIEMSTKATKTRKKILGQEDKATLDSMDMAGLALDMAGRWKEAEELFVRVAEARKTVLGADHPGTLTSMANLASTYREQKRWKEAAELFIQVMKTRKTVLGADHPNTLTGMSKVAWSYRNQGRWKQAEELQTEKLRICERVLGTDHPDMISGRANLALTFWNQGRWKEAEELEIQVMEMRMTVLGADHPQTLTSMHNRAVTLSFNREDAKAVALMEECIRKRIKVLGLNHADTKDSEDELSRWRMKSRMS